MLSSLPTSMALSLSVAMALNAGVILASSHTPQIIQRSETYLISVACSNHSLNVRVLMAGIRNLGMCPCPRCEVPLKDADMVGTQSDRKQRLKLMRKNDIRRELKVSTARRAIYDDNRGVTSARVENQLKEQSLVPAYVSYLWFISDHRVEFFAYFRYRTLSATGFPSSA